jgi:hypothetical protein
MPHPTFYENKASHLIPLVLLSSIAFKKLLITFKTRVPLLERASSNIAKPMGSSMKPKP